jgi:hypothetical protein
LLDHRGYVGGFVHQAFLGPLAEGFAASLVVVGMALEAFDPHFPDRIVVHGGVEGCRGCVPGRSRRKPGF